MSDCEKCVVVELENDVRRTADLIGYALPSEHDSSMVTDKNEYLARLEVIKNKSIELSDLILDLIYNYLPEED